MKEHEVKNFIEANVYIDKAGNPRIPESAVEKMLAVYAPDIIDIPYIVDKEANRRKHENGVPVFLSECRNKIEKYQRNVTHTDWDKALHQIIESRLAKSAAYWAKRYAEEIERKGKPYCHTCKVKLSSGTEQCPQCLSKDLDLMYAP